MANSDLSQMITDIVAGKMSFFELIRSAPEGDYFAHVQVNRLSYLIMKEPEALKAVQTEIAQEMRGAGLDVDGETVEQELARKDGKRRFSKLLTHRAEVFSDSQSLLSGQDFESCLGQYKTLLGHVEHLWASASQTYKLGNFPIAAFMSILVIEETGKLVRLGQDLILYDAPKETTAISVLDRNHRRKHFIGVVSGALINSRLDRVLGKDVVKKLLHEAESDELEKTRQSCLYIDIKDGNPVTPSQQIDEDRARTLVVFAGELMAEVLGHFPWEFERMLENVIAFGREIGFPVRKIGRR
jgi:AbiV family abortive infection protein